MGNLNLRPLVVAAIALLANPGHAQEIPDEEITKSVDVFRKATELWQKIGEAQPVAQQCPDLQDQLGFYEYQAKFDRPFTAEEVHHEMEFLMRWIEDTYHLNVKFLQTEFASDATGYLMCPFTGNDLMKLTYLQELKAALIKIPPHLIAQLDLHTVRFADRIYDHWREEEPSQLAGYVHTESGYVNLIILWPFYHELFHKIDQKMGELMCSEEWQTLHPEDEECDSIAQANERWGQLDKKDPAGRKRWDEEQANMAMSLFGLDNADTYTQKYLPLLERWGSRRQLRVFSDPRMSMEQITEPETKER